MNKDEVSITNSTGTITVVVIRHRNKFELQIIDIDGRDCEIFLIERDENGRVELKKDL